MTLKEEVFLAAKEGNLEKLMSLLKNLNINKIEDIVNADITGARPLMTAARNGHFAVVEYLVNKCLANIESAGVVEFDGEQIEGAPPLWCAAAAGHTSIVRFLVSHGCDVNNTTKTNSTPLRAACFDGHEEIVEYLVDHGADLEIANRHGHTCLMIACYKGHIKIVEYLISKGSQVNRCSNKGEVKHDVHNIRFVQDFHAFASCMTLVNFFVV